MSLELEHFGKELLKSTEMLISIYNLIPYWMIYKLIL